MDDFGSPDSDKVLFHIDEAMSWEFVRNLERMKSTLLLVQNVISQSDAPEEINQLQGNWQGQYHTGKPLAWYRQGNGDDVPMQ